MKIIIDDETRSVVLTGYTTLRSLMTTIIQLKTLWGDYMLFIENIPGGQKVNEVMP